ncbi:MAG: hypothetical protein CMO44_12835 [Verrucomicrobiales bacterium]|nr:hypothetical protein [Verrucomicrobiales bacterium]|tara:strand:+ start:1496 stop:1834 length:339 start_codon:yes stop_codon:yes gene_type:complete
MENITDYIEELSIQKDTEFNLLIDKTNFSDDAKTLIKHLHNRILHLEKSQQKNISLSQQKEGMLGRSQFVPTYNDIDTHYSNHKQNNQTKRKGFMTGMSLAEQKAQEFNRRY